MEERWEFERGDGDSDQERDLGFDGNSRLGSGITVEERDSEGLRSSGGSSDSGKMERRDEAVY